MRSQVGRFRVTVSESVLFAREQQKLHIFLAMKHSDTICIENMVVHGIVGAKPRERIKPQALIVSITLHTDFSFVASTDNLLDAEIDYA